MDEFKQRNAREISVWKKTSTESTDNLIKDEKVAKADSIRMTVEKSLILACFKELVSALQALVNANVKRKVTIKEAMQKDRALLASGRSINK